MVNIITGQKYIPQELPVLGTSGSAGYDIKADIEEPIYIRPGQWGKVATGLKFELTSMWGMLLPRSGLGSRGLILANGTGVIDPDFQGELMVVLWNRRVWIDPLSQDDILCVNPGQSIAQMVFQQYLHPEFNKVTEFHKETQRGDGGFGHTDYS